MKAPVFSHSCVATQTIVVILITGCVAATFYSMHKSEFMHVDPSIAGKADSIFGYFSGLSGFLFGFFVFNGLGTYLTVKNNYLGGFWGAAQNLFVLISCEDFVALKNKKPSGPTVPNVHVCSRRSAMAA